ncbi:MAG TPA: hypothetical protein VGS08_06320 [Candidatus Saccharimonadales bacterium]|nr:hypothetical protein [Candidatus Saccharimonadales bacterium]
MVKARSTAAVTAAMRQRRILRRRPERESGFGSTAEHGPRRMRS